MRDGKQRLLAGAILLGLCMVLVLPASARAGWIDDLDPAEWLKYDAVVTTLMVPNSTDGEDVEHFYLPAVPAGRVSYEWKAEITKVEALIGVLWFDLTSEFGPPGSLYAESEAPHEPAVPFEIIREVVAEPGLLDVVLDHSVVENSGQYQLRTSLTDVVFGKLLGNQISGFRATFVTGINPAEVPEPSSLALMGGGVMIGLVMWRRRRK